MEPQKTKNCQSNPEEKKARGSFRLQTVRQSHRSQNSVVLVQKQTYRSMEHNRVFRNKTTYLWAINLWQRKQNYRMGKKTVISKWWWESWTDECESIKINHTFIICIKINSKWLKVLNISHDAIKLLEDSMGKTFFDINHTNVSLDQSLKATELKTKINGT